MRVQGTRSLGGRWHFANSLAYIVVVAISLSGCLTVPTAQTDAMATATDAIATASDALLAQLNAAEKEIRINKATATDNPTIFVVKNAALYSTLDTYAPTTAVFKAGVDTLKSYAALIRSLSNGESATTAGNQIKTIADNVSKLPGVSASVTLAFNAFLPLVSEALVLQTRYEARSIVLKGRKPVRDLIAALQNATPAMYRLLIAGVDATPDLPKLRVKLSDYVILLERLQMTFDRLADVISDPRQAASVSSLVQSSAELTADAKLLQKAFAL